MNNHQFVPQVLIAELSRWEKRLMLEAYAVDPHSRDLFRHLHLGDKEPAAKEGLAAFQAGLRIRIHFFRIRIQQFRLNANPDPDPIRI